MRDGLSEKLGLKLLWGKEMGDFCDLKLFLGLISTSDVLESYILGSNYFKGWAFHRDKRPVLLGTTSARFLQLGDLSGLNY